MAARVSDYEAYEELLLPYLKMEDPPLERVGDVWQVRAPIDALLHLGHLVGNKDFAQFELVVRTVFGEKDPSLDLPQEKRLYAGIYGKKLKHSNWLRSGLATTLLLMSARHEQLGLTCPAMRPDQFVEKIIAELPGLSDDYHEIASLYGELILLMEAAPRPLLSALERMLEGDGSRIAPIFQDSDPFYSHSPHTGLLWGLEVLAWDPKYISQVTLILAKLARVDPGGKLMNRPMNSMRDILLPWRPQTNAPLAQRIAALDQILAKEPSVGWDLVLKLLPGRHDVVSPSAMPRYREAGASEREIITYGLRDRAYNEIVQRALKLSGDDPQRWALIIKRMSSFDPQQRDTAIALLEGLVGRLDSDQRTAIWSALRDEVSRHRAFPTAQWVTPNSDLERMEAIVLRLQPDDLITCIAWLFNEYHPHIPQPEESDLRLDLVEKERSAAIGKLVLEQGLQGLLKLAETVVLPDQVALAAGSIIEKVEDFSSLVEMGIQGPDKTAFFAWVLSARAELKLGPIWRTQVAKWRLERQWTAEQLASLILGWVDNRDTWDFATSLGDDVERSYWKRKTQWPIHGDPSDLEAAAANYLRAGRAIAAVQALHFVADKISSDTLFRILDAAITELNAVDAQNAGGFIYDLQQIFDSLQRRTDVPLIETAKREYAYLPLLRYQDRSLVLHRVMSEDPQFYAQLLTEAFRPATREVPDPTEQERARASSAYHLLSEFRAIPGMHEGGINEETLREWIYSVQQLAEAEDRLAIGDEYIGHLLAHAPFDSDGAWPHRVVRQLIEDLSSAQFELGIEVERFNMRGPQTRAMYEGGNQERALAQQIREWATAARAWPRTSGMLERIAQSWDEHGAREDERARQDEIKYG